MKDYFDIWVILRETELDYEILRSAVSATAMRRKTVMPEVLPIVLTREFAEYGDKNIQWRIFLDKNCLDPIELVMVVNDLRVKFKYLFE